MLSLLFTNASSLRNGRTVGEAFLRVLLCARYLCQRCLFAMLLFVFRKRFGEFLRTAVLEVLCVSAALVRGELWSAVLLGFVLGLVTFSKLRIAVGARASLALTLALYLRNPIATPLQLLVAAAYLSEETWNARLTLVGLLLLLVAPFCEDLLPITPPERGQLTVVEFNVQVPEREGWAQRTGPLLARARPDLLVLPEGGYAHMPERQPGEPERWFDRVGRNVRGLQPFVQLPHVWSDFPIFTPRGNAQRGTTIYSRWPLREVPETHAPSSLDPPPLLRVERPEGVIFLQPIHLRPPPNPLPPRLQAFEQVLARMPRSGTRLVVGDLNLFPWSRVGIPERYGLRDAMDPPRMFGTTFHADYPFARIDGILYSNTLTLVEARVLQRTESDHRPIRALFR